jgi:predicted small lipoprotein YifL
MIELIYGKKKYIENMTKYILATIIALSLSGCGLKGDLDLPMEKAIGAFSR